ncbi:hypothetical protein [Ralstonia pseudosolanacearum]|uniref:hypothetical protein n=1 Tax=Ralstonia pseudosolanacearum TaxID=1310165 RepID=UPI0038637AB4
MDNRQARAVAFDLLKKLIEHQPNLISLEKTVGADMGSRTAQFCAAFIDTLTAELIKPQD